MVKIHQVRSPNPPDGGWGWIIVLSCLLCNFIIDGTVYSFGVFLPKLVSHFEEGKGTVAWVGSIQSGVYSISGSVASILVNKYGCRVTCIIGSMVGMAALAVSSLSNSLAMLMIYYGVVGGFGFGLIYFSGIVCVNQYFHKGRALAVGITACGTGIGSFLMTPLAAYLLDLYNWKGANLIMAGIVLNCAICGSLMRPLELTQSWDNNSYQTNKFSKTNKSCKINLFSGKTGSDSPVATNDSYCLMENSNVAALRDYRDEVSQPLNTSDRKSIESREQLESNKEPLIDLTLLRNPVYSLMCVSYVFGYLGLFIPHTYIIDFAITRGIGDETASFLVSIIGISNMVGRLFFGYLSDLPAVDALTVMYICTAASSLIAFFIPMCSSYYSLSAISAAFGLFSAPLMSLTSVVLTNMLGVSQMVKALGLLLFLFGFSIILGSPLAGWIFDWTQGYLGPFWFSGATLLLASVLLVITSLVFRYQKREPRIKKTNRLMAALSKQQQIEV